MGAREQKGLRETIEGVISKYCDGTYDGLEGATFVEYSEGHKLPQECAKDMEVEILALLQG